MNIKDPRNFPWKLNSPYEIYAAGRWNGSREDPVWKTRARRWAELNSGIYRGELSGSEISTIGLVRELFFLHLTVREETLDITKALSFLKNREGTQVQLKGEMPDIPFEPEGDLFFITHAWLFSSAVFGQSGSFVWQQSAENAGKRIQSEAENINSRSLYNFLRGTLIIPEAEQITGVKDAVRNLAVRQNSSGFFEDIAPWQIYNLMAHSTQPEAIKILEKLEPPLLKLQNSDSSWGAGNQKATAAFLMAHGLQNRGYFN